MMLRPPVLSKQTIHNFMGEFKKRKASRLKRSEEQRRHDMRANAELSREAGMEKIIISNFKRLLIIFSTKTLYKLK